MPANRSEHYSKFGAHVGQSALEFSVYFPGPDEYERGGQPDIRELRVLGSFQARKWDLDSAPYSTTLTRVTRMGFPTRGSTKTGRIHRSLADLLRAPIF